MASIDTPGFDDTERTDADVLELIAKFLRETYANGMLLTGIILLQPVTGNRVQGSEKRRTRLLFYMYGMLLLLVSHVIKGSCLGTMCRQ